MDERVSASASSHDSTSASPLAGFGAATGRLAMTYGWCTIPPS